jgi:GTP cyclohydrolase II
LKCKKLARKYQKELNWEKEKWENGYKDTIMKKALTYKFSQNPDMLKKLLDTGDAKLVEASQKDPYWGGLLPDSKNKLGDFLAQLRDNYRKDKKVYVDGSGLEPIETKI